MVDGALRCALCGCGSVDVDVVVDCCESARADACCGDASTNDGRSATPPVAPVSVRNGVRATSTAL